MVVFHVTAKNIEITMSPHRLRLPFTIYSPPPRSVSARGESLVRLKATLRCRRLRRRAHPALPSLLSRVKTAAAAEIAAAPPM